MAIKEAGIRLVAQNYTQYIGQLKEINRAHKEAFSTAGLSNYSNTAKHVTSEQKRLRDATDSTWSVIQNLRKGFDTTATSGSRFGDIMSKVSGAIGSVKGHASQATSGLGNLVGGFGKMILKVSGVLLLLEQLKNAMDFIAGGTELAGQVEVASIALEEVGKRSGYSAEQINYAVESLKQQGITSKAAISSLNRMARANISWAQASDLAAIAQGAAAAEGLNSSETFEKLIKAVQREEAELVDQLGINLKLEPAFKAYADSVGKTTKELTQQERTQALVNTILKQGEPLLKVYGLTAETATKQQSSLARVQEETQLQFGKALLPIKTAGIQLQTTLWKGLNQATKGISVWGSAMSAVGGILKSSILAQLKLIFPGLNSLWKSLSDGRGFADRLGEAIFNFGKIVTLVFTLAQASIDEFRENMGGSLRTLGTVWLKFSTGDFVGGLKAIKDGTAAAVSGVQDRFSELWDEQLKRNPDLAKSWRELNTAIEEVDLTRNQEEQELLADSTEEANEALQTQLEVYKRLEKIQRSFNENMAKARKEGVEALKKADEDAAIAREKLDEKHAKDSAKLEEDSVKERSDLINSFNKDQRREQKKLHDDLARERRRFQLTQMQETRKFQVQDRRLRAEGDVLALMQLREDFELQQKEAKENFEFGQQEAQDSAQTQAQEAQEDQRQRLQELDAQLEERKKELQSSYTEELANLAASNAEKKAEIEKANQERLLALINARDNELKELGRSLQDEQKITEEGMQAIGEEIWKIFGDEGAGASAIAGFRERSTTEIGRMIVDLQQQLKALETSTVETAANMSRAFASVPLSNPKAAGFSGSNPSTITGGSHAGVPGFPRPFGMRKGGVGVVTGPAMFEVEAGQREAVMFAPLPTMSRNLNVNMSGGFDIRGSEKIGREATEAAIDQMILEFQMAVERLSRRGK